MPDFITYALAYLSLLIEFREHRAAKAYARSEVAIARKARAARARRQSIVTPFD